MDTTYGSTRPPQRLLPATPLAPARLPRQLPPTPDFVPMATVPADSDFAMVLRCYQQFTMDFSRLSQEQQEAVASQVRTTFPAHFSTPQQPESIWTVNKEKLGGVFLFLSGLFIGLLDRITNQKVPETLTGIIAIISAFALAAVGFMLYYWNVLKSCFNHFRGRNRAASL